MRRFSSTILAGLIVSMIGCMGVPLDDQPPADFDLSGRWVSAAGDRGSSSDSRSGFMTQDFPLLVSKELRIQQDARSMGIEYERGKYRDVTWGDRKRGVWEVRAGWHEGNLHIFTEAPDTSAIEVWQLSEDGRQLVIDVEVKAGRTHHFHRVFSRSDPL